MKSGIELIAEERQKQIDKHGYDSQHDADHTFFELTKAAAAYAKQATMQGMCIWQTKIPEEWPFNPSEWRPLPRHKGTSCPMITSDDSIGMLTTAGALIAAEIDRLQKEKQHLLNESPTSHTGPLA